MITTWNKSEQNQQSINNSITTIFSSIYEVHIGNKRYSGFEIATKRIVDGELRVNRDFIKLAPAFIFQKAIKMHALLYR